MQSRLSTLTFIKDYDFKAGNPSGGQMSSLSDLVRLAKTFLDPTSESSVVPPVTMLEWLKPAYNFFGGVISVGIPWEITRTRQAFGRSVEEYSKG